MRNYKMIPVTGFDFNALNITVIDYTQWSIDPLGKVHYEKSIWKFERLPATKKINSVEDLSRLLDSKGTAFLGNNNGQRNKPTSIFNVQFRYKGKLISYRSLPIDNIAMENLDNLPRLVYSEESKWTAKFSHQVSRNGS